MYLPRNFLRLAFELALPGFENENLSFHEIYVNLDGPTSIRSVRSNRIDFTSSCCTRPHVREKKTEGKFNR